MKISPKMKSALIRFGRTVGFAILSQIALLSVVQWDITNPKLILIALGTAVVTGTFAGIDKFVRTK